jgi:putative flippase GtrA
MNSKSQTQLTPSMRGILRGRLIKFGTVGFSGTLINLIALYLNQEYLFRGVESVERRLPLSLASAIFIATVNNFIWNRVWTWKDRKQEAGHGFFSQMVRYFFASGFAIGIQYLCTMAFSQVVHYVLANLLSIGVGALLNYLVNDSWTFAARKKISGAGRIDTRSVLCSESITAAGDFIGDRHSHTYL